MAYNGMVWDGMDRFCSLDGAPSTTLTGAELFLTLGFFRRNDPGLMGPMAMMCYCIQWCLQSDICQDS